MRIAGEGYPFVAVPAGMALALAGLGRRRAAVPFALASLAAAGFFRDPDRQVPDVAGAVLAPADGRVVRIERIADPFVGDAVRVSIFLSPLDVHINRAPIAGLVVAKEHIRGRHLAAYRPEASRLNERCVLQLAGEGVRATVIQIAGVLARRIVCRAEPGDKLAAGERFGLIRFGSRTDVAVASTAEVRVLEGDRVRAGETVIGVLR